jgi:hypothetical protein
LGEAKGGVRKRLKSKPQKMHWAIYSARGCYSALQKRRTSRVRTSRAIALCLEIEILHPLRLRSVQLKELFKKDYPLSRRCPSTALRAQTAAWLIEGMIFFEKGREYAPSRKKSYLDSATPKQPAG